MSSREQSSHLRKQADRGSQPRYHDLRHSAASLLIAEGVHPRLIMETLGHSQISVTMNLYGHVAPVVQRQVAAHMDGLLTG